jgi:hypothetical protein
MCRLLFVRSFGVPLASYRLGASLDSKGQIRVEHLSCSSLGEEIEMRRTPILGMAFLVVLAAPARASEKEALALIERAIKVQGGEAALTKAQQATRTDKGTQALLGRDVPFTSKVTRSLPDKVRLEIELDKKVKTTIVLNGNKGWQTEGGPAAQQSAQRVKEMREEVYVWWLTTLVPLKKKSGFTLSTIPDVKVDGEAAAGIKVVRKGYADTRMYFLKRNGVLVKIERRVSEAGLPVDKEYLYSAYKDFDGVKLHAKELIKVNGRKWTEFTISDYRFPAKLDAGTFAKP